MSKSIKVKAGERLDDTSIKAVIKAMGVEPPISKKVACSMLNITYNTSRLANIITDYNDKVAYRRKQRAAVRKTPVTTSDKKSIIQSFVSGTALGDIVKESFRSMLVIKKVLSEFSLPLRSSVDTRVLIEEGQTAQDYEKGDLVYSAKYSEYAEICMKVQESEEHGAVYRIYILGNHAQYAVQPYYELIDLRKAQDELDISLFAPTGLVARTLVRG